MTGGNCNDYDPDTLTTILTMNIEDQNNWASPLNRFKDLLHNLKTKDPPSLEAPFSDLTDNFIYSCMPKVVRKCLETALQPDVPVVSFLEEVITTIAFSINVKHSLQLIPLLNSIFDTSQIFYTHNGRVENQPYSKHLTNLANHCLTTEIPTLLIDSFITDEFLINDFVESSIAINRLSVFVEITKMLPDTEKVVNAMVFALGKFGFDPEDRQIPYRQVLMAIPNIINISHHEDVINILTEIMMRFLDIEIADMKIAGIKISVILYTYILSTTNSVDPAIQSTFEYILAQVNNIEALQILKPLLCTFAERGALSNELINGLWNVINSMTLSVMSKAIDLFVEVALKLIDISQVLQIATNPPNMELLTKLINGKRYTESITNQLVELAEERHDPKALEALVNVAKTIDLTNHLPTIYSNIGEPKLLKDNIKLIQLIFEKSPQMFDLNLIFSHLAINFAQFSDDEIRDTIRSCASILRQAMSKISKNDLEALFANCANKRSIITIIKELVHPDIIFIETSAFPVLIDIVKRAKNEFELFEAVQRLHYHINLLIQNSELCQSISNVIWNVLLYPNSEEQRQIASSTLLTFANYMIMPKLIKDYVQFCINELIKLKNKYAAIFISECLKYFSKFVYIGSLGQEQHRFYNSDDLIDITFQSGDQTQMIQVNDQMYVYELIPLLSDLLHKEVDSINLFIENQLVSTELLVIEVMTKPEVFEVRTKDIFCNFPKITNENNPYSLFNDNNAANLLKLLEDPNIAENVYNILIQIPTPSVFNLESLKELDPSLPYLLLYNLHYLTRNIEKMGEDKAKFQKIAENLLTTTDFDQIVPEARYLLALLLDPTTKNEYIVTKFLYNLCIKTDQYFMRTSRIIWQIISNYDIPLDEDILSVFLLYKNKEFTTCCLSSKLILSQSFEKVWDIFNSKCDNKSEFLNVFNYFDIPEKYYSQVFNEILPYFESLDEKILSIFSKLCCKWSDFPFEQITPILIDSYIKCTKRPTHISDHPFQLMLSIVNRSPEKKAEILNYISATIPEISEYDYTPADSFKTYRSGLSNLGATCYANSVLQQIYSIDSIRNFIISNRFADDPSMAALSELFTKMFYGHRKYIDMREFASKWTGWDGTHIKPREQQDANEFLMLLFSRLENYPEIYSLISGSSTTTLTGAGFSTTQTTLFNTLQLLVMGMNSISDSLNAFQLPEIIENYKVDDGKAINVESVNSLNKLPPFLFVQLKRFDYSIETGMRSKLDQRYQFEDVVDFANYVSKRDDDNDNDNENQESRKNEETRYRLKGVIIHQGEAEAGHYYSYIKLPENNQWYCANDNSIKESNENEMRNEAYGKPDGTSAYLLLYERFDAKETTIAIPVEPNEKLKNEILDDNLHFVIDTVYFTDFFAKFIQSLISIDGCFETSMKYYSKVLAHSSLTESFVAVSDKIRDLIKSSDSMLDNIVYFIQNNFDFVIGIMTSPAKKRTKEAFSSIIAEIFKLLPVDNDLIIIFAGQLVCWCPIILENWRNGFDFFKIFYEYGLLGEDHINFIEELSIVQGIISFVTDTFQPYVTSHSGSISLERFKQYCDLTYAFKLFEITSTPIEEILNPKFLKWVVGSLKHQQSFIHYVHKVCPPCLPQFDKYIAAAEVAPSEALVAELIKCPEFRIPPFWLNTYFAEPAEQKHLLRAFVEIFLCDFNIFQMFVEIHTDALCHFLFSPTFEVREEVTEFLTKIQTKNPAIELLLPIVFRIVDVSKNLYSKPDYKANYLPLDCFVGRHFLNFLVENAPKLDSLGKYVQVFENTLRQLVEIKAQRDEHSIPLAQIGIMMMNDITIESISPQFIADIETVVIKMIPDHRLLDQVFKQFCLGLILQSQKSKNFPVELLMPDNELKNYLFKIIFSRDAKPAKRAAIDLVHLCCQRYATGTRAIKFLYAELAKMADESNRSSVKMENVFEVLCEFHKDVVISNLAMLITQENIMKLFVSEIRAIRVNPNVFQKMIVFYNIWLENENHSFQGAINAKPECAKSLIQMAADMTLDYDSRILVLKLVENVLPFIGEKNFRLVYGDIVLAKSIKGIEIDNYVQTLISNFLSESVNNSNSNDSSTQFIQQKIAEEFFNATISASNARERFAMFAKLTDVVRNSIENIGFFIERMAKSGVLPAIWSIAPDVQVMYEGLFRVTENAIKREVISNEDAKEIGAAAQKCANEEKYHKLMSELAQNL